MTTDIEIKSIELEQKLLQIQEEGQVTIHCKIPCSPGLLVRIWQSTFIYPNNGAERIPLAHAENISIAPIWTPIPNSGIYGFTLIFGGLPKTCTAFDLIEEIKNDFFPFSVFGIERTETDVYTIWI